MTGMTRAGLPFILLPGCTNETEKRTEYQIAERYLDAVYEKTDGLPLVLAPFAELSEGTLEDTLARFDGVVLTGGVSNIAPEHYGAPIETARPPQDRKRDALCFALVRAALRQSIPLLAICRGMEELNVALGGSLIDQLQDLPGKLDHRYDDSIPYDQAFLPRHAIAIRPQGILARLAGERTQIQVNSLHEQGIGRLAEGLFVEAVSPDGVIEAVSLPRSGFVLGVQWHPEHFHVRDDWLNDAIWSEFARQVRKRQSLRVSAAAS